MYLLRNHPNYNYNMTKNAGNSTEGYQYHILLVLNFTKMVETFLVIFVFSTLIFVTIFFIVWFITLLFRYYILCIHQNINCELLLNPFFYFCRHYSKMSRGGNRFNERALEDIIQVIIGKAYRTDTKTDYQNYKC